MGNGSTARAFLACATIVSLVVFIAGLCLSHFMGPMVLRPSDAQRLLTHLAGRLQGHLGAGGVGLAGRKMLQCHAATTRPLLLLVADSRNRVILSLPDVPFLAGLEVDASRISPHYGRPVSPHTRDDRSRLLDRFYPSGHYVAFAEVKTAHGKPAGYLWETRAPSPAIAAYAWPAVAGGVAYWLLLPWWVFVDARIRRARALPFAVLTLAANAAGWAAYMVTRPEQAHRCGVCQDEVSGECLQWGAAGGEACSSVSIADGRRRW